MRWSKPIALASAALIVTLPLGLGADTEPVCLHVSSFHEGHPWTDRISEGLQSTLAGVCSLQQFHMDSLRKPDQEHTAEATDAALALIEHSAPAVLIATDDHVAKQLVTPYLRDSGLPVVFAGINWTVEEYGMPFSNTTGIVEVAPLKPLLQAAMEATPQGDDSDRVSFLAGMSLDGVKDSERFEVFAKALGLNAQILMADSLATWEDLFRVAQNSRFVVLGSHAGIKDWDQASAETVARDATRRLTVTNHKSMMPFSILGYTKVPEELGEWAGLTAKAILDGTDAADIPLVTNRRWDAWLNRALLAQTDIELNHQVTRKAKSF